jgi:hypothetical protein
MRKFLLLIVVLCLSSGAASAKLRKFVWYDEICSFQGAYNTSLYTERQLENTFQMWYSRDFTMEIYQARGLNLDGSNKIRPLASYDAEYARKSAALRKLEIVNTPYWLAYKQKKLKRLEQDYKFGRITAEAFTNPAALRKLTFAKLCVKKYAPLLVAGGDDLMRFWRAGNEETIRKSDNPEQTRKDFENIYNSADKFEYARSKILGFDWWDCVSGAIRSGDDDDNPENNFAKLFTHVVTLGCDYA